MKTIIELEAELLVAHTMLLAAQHEVTNQQKRIESIKAAIARLKIAKRTLPA